MGACMCADLTRVMTKFWRWALEDLMNWKKSTTCSVLSLSIMAWMVMKAPVRPIPSLGGGTTATDCRTGEEELTCTPLSYMCSRFAVL